MYYDRKMITVKYTENGLAGLYDDIADRKSKRKHFYVPSQFDFLEELLTRGAESEGQNAPLISPS